MVLEHEVTNLNALLQRRERLGVLDVDKGDLEHYRRPEVPERDGAALGGCRRDAGGEHGRHERRGGRRDGRGRLGGPGRAESSPAIAVDVASDARLGVLELLP